LNSRKKKLIYGPNQISAMIDQSTVILNSSRLGSKGLRSDSAGSWLSSRLRTLSLCVPLYLKAEGTNFPQLKRVIVATGDKVVMEPTLDEALGSLFGTSPGLPSQAGQPSGTQRLLPKAVLDQARAQLAEAQKAIQFAQRPAGYAASIGGADEADMPMRQQTKTVARCAES